MVPEVLIPGTWYLVPGDIPVLPLVINSITYLCGGGGEEMMIITRFQTPRTGRYEGGV